MRRTSGLCPEPRLGGFFRRSPPKNPKNFTQKGNRIVERKDFYVLLSGCLLLCSAVMTVGVDKRGFV